MLPGKGLLPQCLLAWWCKDWGITLMQKWCTALYQYQTGFDAWLLFLEANDLWVIKQMNFLMMTNTGECTVLRREHDVQPKRDLWEIVMLPKIYNGKIREQEKLLEDLVYLPGKTTYFQTKDGMYNPLHASSWYLHCFGIYMHIKPKTCTTLSNLNTIKIAIEKKFKFLTCVKMCKQLVFILLGCSYKLLFVYGVVFS